MSGRASLHLHALVLVVGAASLGTEIAAARLLAPFFGASTIVWANTIATVLLALAVGYWIGGRLSDRRPTMGGLCRVVVLAAVALAATPIVARPLLPAASRALENVSAGAFLGSLAAVLSLVAVPVLLLGMVAPYALRLAIVDVEHSGSTGGRLYAISTVGSLFGTFLAALVLVPFAGTRLTFFIFALALLVAALPGDRRVASLAALPVAAAALFTGGSIKSVERGRVLYEVETPYQYARVVENNGVRRLELNEGHAVHSHYAPGRFLTGDYWDDLLAAPLVMRAGIPGMVAILGNAAGTVARSFGHFMPQTHVTGVEIDGALSRIGRKYFDLRPGPRLSLVTADARPFLRTTPARFDAILVDAYRQPYIPFYLTTKEFFAEARTRLTTGGIVAINVGHPVGSHELERVLSATLRTQFGVVQRDPVRPTNTILIAGRQADELRSGAPTGLGPTVDRMRRRLAPALTGGAVYTDDRAPVEWLIDGSLVRYAGAG
jgi:spermidine synthase